jgi:hypothetical protein
MDFDADYRKVGDNRSFRIAWASLLILSEDAAEIDVQTSLADVIKEVSNALGIQVRVKHSERMAVGGILAHNKYDVRGATDIDVRNTDDDCLLVIEVKTHETIANDNWYRDHRACQVIASLFYFNGPVFLATNKGWKMFFENCERNSIFTYPTGSSGDSFVELLEVEVMGRQFVRAIIICLTAKPAEPPAAPSPYKTPQKGTIAMTAQKPPDSNQKRRTPAKRPRYQLNNGPKYESVDENGVIEMINVRIYDDEDLDALDELLASEKVTNVFEYEVDDRAVA